MSNENDEKLITRDWLAIERTKLANERTFLAYFRTAIVFLASGITIYTMEIFEEIKLLGIFLTLVAPFILLIGIIRLRNVNKHIRKYYGYGSSLGTSSKVQFPGSMLQPENLEAGNWSLEPNSSSDEP